MPAKKISKKKIIKEKFVRTNHNIELFKELFEIRKKIAEEKMIPNFFVFNDDVLKEFSYYYPISKENFLLIKGVGENKFEKYGNEFSKVIKDFKISDNELSKRNEELIASVPKKIPKLSMKEKMEIRKIRVKELILKKTSIVDIAHDLELTEQTIGAYVGRLLVDDANLEIDYIKESIEAYAQIVKAFEKLGSEKIGPIYAEFGGNVEYSDINLVKNLLLSK